MSTTRDDIREVVEGAVTPEKADSMFVVVALVSSAGGVEALQRVLGPLPEDFPATVIALQHLPPDRPSLLHQVLQRRCALPVRIAQHGDRLEPAAVFVAPEGSHLLVTTDGSLALVTSGPSPPYRPSADLLLTSMALCLGPRAIAVILSGTGRDGATGGNVVHDFGGTVIAADPASSAYDAMPRAAIDRDDVVDFVVPIDEIPSLLEKLVAAPRATAHPREEA